MIRGVVLHENGPVTIQKNPLQVWLLQWLSPPSRALGAKRKPYMGITTPSFPCYHTRRRISDTKKTPKRDVKSRASAARGHLAEQTPENYEQACKRNETLRPGLNVDKQIVNCVDNEHRRVVLPLTAPQSGFLRGASRRSPPTL